MKKYLIAILFPLFFPSFSFAQDSLSVVRDSLRNIHENEGKVLKEVVVEASNAIVNGNKTSYLPTKNQRNASRNGVDLLFNIDVPQLDVNPMTGSISAYDNTSVSIYIDNRRASAAEISRLRAKDIKKVEFYENAYDQFPGEQKVINYVLVHYTSGGYVDIDTDTRFIAQSGTYRAQLSLDSKNTNYTLLAGAGYKKDDGIGGETDERICLEPTFDRLSVSSSGESRKKNYYGLFRVTHNSKNATMFGQLSYSYNKTPENSIKSSVTYTPEVYPASASISTSKDKSSALHGNFYYRKKFKKGNTFYTQIAYDFSDNSYNRLYQESEIDEETRNSSSEKLHRVDARVNYVLKTGKTSSLSFFLWDVLRISNADYTYATSASNQKLTSNDVVFYPTYQTTLWKRLIIGLQAGLNYNSYHVSGTYSLNKINLRPALTLNYSINERNRLLFDIRMGSSTPLLRCITAVEQRVNHYHILRGNPELKTTKLVNTRFSHNLILNNLRLSNSVSWDRYINITQSTYAVENNTLVQSYSTAGSYNNAVVGSHASLSLFKKKLRLSGGVDFRHFSVSGLYRRHKNNLTYTANAMYYMSQFHIYAYYRSKSIMLSATPTTVRNADDYGLAAGWQKNGWYFEIGGKRIFNGVTSQKSSFSSEYYTFDKRSYSDNLGRIVYVKASYNFDFGRTVKHNKLEMDTSTQSGILRI